MHYHSLYKQYAKEADTLKAYIKTLKNTACESESLKWRISTLYAMYLDLRHTAQYLKIRCEGTKND